MRGKDVKGVLGVERAAGDLGLGRAAEIRDAHGARARSGSCSRCVEYERLEGGRAGGRHEHARDRTLTAVVFERAADGDVVGDFVVDGRIGHGARRRELILTLTRFGERAARDCSLCLAA